MRYIHVFSEKRDTANPLITLYDNDGIALFFQALIESPRALRYFPGSRIKLISFERSQQLDATESSSPVSTQGSQVGHISLSRWETEERQIGTAIYSIVDGKIQVQQETGELAHLLENVGML